MNLNRILFIAALSAMLAVSSCAGPDEKKYLDPGAPVDERVEDLMKRMTLEEKVAQMCQYVAPDHLRKSQKQLKNKAEANNDTYSLYRGMTVDDVEKLTEEGMIGSFLHVTTAEEANYLQSLAGKSRLGIPLLIGIDAIHGNGLVGGSTIYPSPIAIASTWCDSLQTVISRQTAMEMRAMGAQWTFTPNIDIARDPRWGRFGETFGEDTYIAGQMGVASIKGFQGKDFTGKDKVVACAKHMVAGGDPVNGTNASPTDVSMYTLNNMHLVPYLRAVREAGVGTVMMAHNELNGMPCHANKYLMTDVLRKRFGFDGFIVSDWMDIERIAAQGVAASEEEAFTMSVKAGMDMHMHGPKFFEGIVKAVKEGRLPESRVDEACAKILETKFRLGLFENPMVDLDAISESTFTEEYKSTALEAVRKGIVLLKNDGILPLGKGSGIHHVFLSGLNADNHSILGDWVHPQPDENVITIRRGLEELCDANGVAFEYFNCGNNVSRFEIEDKTDEAVRAAAGTDVAVVAVGENSLRYLKNTTCGENIDRADITLLNNQRDLVRKLKAAGIPVVVVFVTGRPLAEEWIAENADAVLWAWEPGCMGGQALAEILFGKVNPSGKMTATVPRHVGQTKMYYNTKPFHYFHTPVDIKKGALYDFGYGMSYTSYSYSGLTLSSMEITPDGKVSVSVNVANTGDVAGEEIVQLYIRDNVSSLTRPVKELKGYKRVRLAPGQSKKVEFSVSARDLAYYDADMNLMAEKGEFSLMVGSSSRDADLLSANVTLTENVKIE